MSVCQFAVRLKKNSIPSVQNFVIFFTEKFYYNFVEKIQIVLISDNNIMPYTCGLLLLLGETPLSKITTSIFAHDGTITSEGLLLYWVRMERLLPVNGARIFCASFVQAVVKRQSCRRSNGTCCDFFIAAIK
jgi:hypothetical protein